MASSVYEQCDLKPGVSTVSNPGEAPSQAALPSRAAYTSEDAISCKTFCFYHASWVCLAAPCALGYGTEKTQSLELEGHILPRTDASKFLQTIEQGAAAKGPAKCLETLGICARDREAG